MDGGGLSRRTLYLNEAARAKGNINKPAELFFLFFYFSSLRGSSGVGGGGGVGG